MAKEKLTLDPSLSISIAAPQMMEKQLLAVLDLCNSFEEHPEKSIHGIRRAFKKCRSLLRLVRDPMGYGSYYLENSSLRDLQRLLSPARDRSVTLRSLEMISATYPEDASGTWWQRTLKKAVELRESANQEIRERGYIEEISAGTQRAIDRIEFYHLDDNGFTLISGGLHRIYDQGRSLMKETYEEEFDPVLIHSFRKKAKYLQYQLSFLTGLFPDVLKATKRSLQKLTDPLGRCRDLYNIRKDLEELSAGYRYGHEKKDHLFGLLHEEMLNLKNDTSHLAHQVYAESPDHFTGRLRSYYQQYMNSQMEK